MFLLGSGPGSRRHVVLTPLTWGYFPLAPGFPPFYTEVDVSGCETFLHAGEFPRADSQR